MSVQNFYSQPIVDAVAPDAIVFIDTGSGRKRTISLKTINNSSGKIENQEVDLMLFVNSISVSKGIDRVPSEASITLRAPRHMMYNFYGSIKDALSTMQEIEIYMKGRFLMDSGDPQYYPVFWGIISNLSESEPAGDLVTVTVSCQDMLRWLAVTKINIQPSALNSSIAGVEQTGNVTIEQQNVSIHPYGSYYVDVSTPGIIRSLFNASTSEGFTKTQGISDRNLIDAGSAQTVTITDAAVKESQLINMWQKKFDTLSSAFFIYGYTSDTSTQNAMKIPDVVLDPSSYNYIYGYTKQIITEDIPEMGLKKQTEVEVPLLDISKMFPFGAGAFNTQSPPTFVSNYQNRLDVAIEAKDSVQLEFYQDTDGTIILKPQFYNMDTRQNKIYMIDDIDILNFNEVEDESQVITRIDATGTYVSGMSSDSAENANPIYGFAIDYDKLFKYGLRVTVINSNHITSPDAIVTYAQRELARRNSLVSNGSLTIQGRPELKLGYPVYLSSKDMFCYVSGIEHSFSFGGSFETTLSLTAFRKKRTDNLGNILKNLLVQTDGSTSNQLDQQGKNFNYNNDDPLKNVTRLCNSDSVANSYAERPNYRYKALDEIMKYQGTFKYIKNEKKTTFDPRLYQQITDDEGYELIGNGYPFAKELSLTEDFRIIVKQAQKDKIAEIISSMTIESTKTKTLRYQQPLTLEQVQNVQVVTSKSSVADAILKMGPNNTVSTNSAATSEK